MDWQSIMAALEQWLWQTPYLDMPNYAWIAAALGVLVLVLYLVMAMTSPAKPGEEPALEKPAEPEEESEPASPTPETVKPPSPPEEAAHPPEKTKASEEPLPEPETMPEPAPRPREPEPAVQPPEPEEAAEEALEEVELTPPEGWFSRLRSGLAKTQDKLAKKLEGLLSRGEINDDLMEELEELMITSDLGVKTSMALLEGMTTAVKKEKMKDPEKVREWLKNRIREILAQTEQPLEIPAGQAGPFVIMVTGVNGAGKTTTIGKLAMRFRQEGKTVLLGAADTFRAAAIQQLEIWAKRAGCRIVAHQEGADPSAVAFDAIKAAQARGVDVVILDTAGRLHTKVNLMEEVKKVKRIVGRELPGAPHEILLVLDATTGQNAVQQAKMFHQALEITGLVLTKLDGTAKGGIIIAISDEFKIPIRFIGVGEKIYDLQPFHAAEFVEALFG